MEERDQVNQVEFSNGDFSVDFKEIFRMLLKFAWLIVALAVIGGGIAFAKVQFLSQDTYTTDCTVYVHKTGTDNVTSGDLTIAKAYTEMYQAVVLNPVFLDRVNEKLTDPETGKSKYSTGEIARAIDVTVEKQMLLKISVTTADSQKSYEISKAVYDSLPELEEIMGDCSAKPLNKPIKPGKDAKNYAKPMLIGTGAGLLLAFVIVFIIYALDTKVRKSEDVAKRYQVPILGELLLLAERDEK